MIQRQIHPSSEVSELATLGNNVTVWQYAHIRESVVIGNDVNIGRGVYIGNGVNIGNNCKIQNYSLIYEPAKIGDGVFIGPGVILTNDLYPRAVNEDGTVKSANDWQPQIVNIKGGASIGAGSICIAPVEIGAWALVAAGSIVTKDVNDFSLVAGSPAKQIGWVGKAGAPLKSSSKNKFECPITGDIYIETKGLLTPTK